MIKIGTWTNYVLAFEVPPTFPMLTRAITGAIKFKHFKILPKHTQSEC